MVDRVLSLRFPVWNLCGQGDGLFVSFLASEGELGVRIHLTAILHAAIDLGLECIRFDLLFLALSNLDCGAFVRLDVRLVLAEIPLESWFFEAGDLGVLLLHATGALERVHALAYRCVYSLSRVDLAHSHEVLVLFFHLVLSHDFSWNNLRHR